jgi:multicomponent Na+:H+ antiporter subunit B
MRILGLLLVVVMGAIIVWGSSDLPQRGDPLAPAAVHDSVAVYYIENAYTDSRTPNMVTAVLADYRGFDTFGEAVVVVAAALSCMLILLRRRENQADGAPGKPAAGASPEPGSKRGDDR